MNPSLIIDTLKFRIYDKINQKFWNNGAGFSIKSLAASYREILLMDGETYVLSAATEYKDKNNQEIYEGDIIQIGSEKDNSERRATIVFRYGGFYLGEMNEPIYKVAYNQDCCEIVGNIFQKEIN